VTEAGKVLTHRQLMREIWGEAAELGTHLLRVNISNLRHKIEADPAPPIYLPTEPGVGHPARHASQAPGRPGHRRTPAPRPWRPRC